MITNIYLFDVQGSYRNKDATVVSLNVDKFSVSVTVGGAEAADTSRGAAASFEIPYEDVSKIA